MLGQRIIVIEGGGSTARYSLSAIAGTTWIKNTLDQLSQFMGSQSNSYVILTVALRKLFQHFRAELIVFRVEV